MRPLTAGVLNYLSCTSVESISFGEKPRSCSSNVLCLQVVDLGEAFVPPAQGLEKKEKVCVLGEGSKKKKMLLLARCIQLEELFVWGFFWQIGLECLKRMAVLSIGIDNFLRQYMKESL